MKLLLSFLLGLIIGGTAIYCKPQKTNCNTVLNTYKFTKQRSGPISLEQAKNMHRKYWNKCIAANENPARILRYLRVEKSDLDLLSKNLKPNDAIRIYFGDISGRTDKNFANTELTTFLVGVDSSGSLRLNDARINIGAATTNIVDNLPPCPDDCPGNDEFFLDR